MANYERKRTNHQVQREPCLRFPVSIHGPELCLSLEIKFAAVFLACVAAGHVTKSSI